MRSLVIAAASLAVGAFASPALGRRDSSWCMTDDESKHVADNFASLISAYSNATADRVLCTSFTDYSDSVIELIDNACYDNPLPLGVATFTSRAAFEAGQGSQPNITFNILNTWNACRAVAIRWRTPSPGFEKPEQQVTGIIVAEVVRASGPERKSLLAGTSRHC